jgi:hypothetical protein
VTGETRNVEDKFDSQQIRYGRKKCSMRLESINSQEVGACAEITFRSYTSEEWALKPAPMLIAAFQIQVSWGPQSLPSVHNPCPGRSCTHDIGPSTQKCFQNHITIDRGVRIILYQDSTYVNREVWGRLIPYLSRKVGNLLTLLHSFIWSIYSSF